MIITVARKPFAGTVAQNVLGYGCGALNVDGCRVGDEVRYNAPAANKPGGAAYQLSVTGMPTGVDGSTVKGRWPANLIVQKGLDDPNLPYFQVISCPTLPTP